MNSSSSASAMSPSPNLKQRSLRPFVVLCALLFGLSLSAFGQTATIVGTVTDASGGVLPNVTIKITNTATGVTKTSPTNDVGQYALPDVQIGTYDVTATAQGFKVQARTGVVVNATERVRQDFQMAVGGSAETITVEATALHVQTDSGEQRPPLVSKAASGLVAVPTKAPSTNSWSVLESAL